MSGTPSMARATGWARRHKVWSSVIAVFVGLVIIGAIFPAPEEADMAEKPSAPAAVVSPSPSAAQAEPEPTPTPTVVAPAPTPAAATAAAVPPVPPPPAAPPQPAPAQAKPDPAPEPERPEGYISRAMVGAKEWPLTVKDGVISCDNYAVYFTSGGKRYAVNGTARSRKDAPIIEPIWRTDPDYPDLGMRVSIGPIIDRGLELCED